MNVTALRVGDILLPSKQGWAVRMMAKVCGEPPVDAALVVTVNQVDQWAIILVGTLLEPRLEVIETVEGCRVFRPNCGRMLKEKVHLWLTREARRVYAPWRFVAAWAGLPVTTDGHVGTVAGLIKKAYASQDMDVAPTGSLANTEASEWIF